jgi:outer membrane protein assembly factor BamE (lipoprotein component of BamABCDE complex)
VATELTQQAQASTQAESDALSQAQQAAPADSGTINITLGMSIDDVVAVMGKPDRIADLGSKKTYFYTSANMKVIFTDGKVTDVQ